MMIRMINKLTQTEMQVAEARVEEYLAAGHKLAADNSAGTADTSGAKKETKSRKASKK